MSHLARSSRRHVCYLHFAIATTITTNLEENGGQCYGQRGERGVLCEMSAISLATMPRPIESSHLRPGAVRPSFATKCHVADLLACLPSLYLSLFPPHSLDTPFFCALSSLFLVFCLLHFANNFHVDKMRRQHPKKKRRNEMRLNNLCRAAKRNSGILNQEEGCKENKVNNSIRSYNEMTLTASSFCFSLNNC